MGNEPIGGEGQQAQGGGDKIGQMIQGVQSAIQALSDNLGGQIPPEAQKALDVANQAYGQFVSALGGGGEQAMGNQSDSASGNSSAVPADQPMKKGMVPA
jgi:hypothetical protein